MQSYLQNDRSKSSLGWNNPLSPYSKKDGCNTRVGHEETQSWQAVHFSVKCQRLTAPGGITGSVSGSRPDAVKSPETGSNPLTVATPMAEVLIKLRRELFSTAGCAKAGVFFLSRPEPASFYRLLISCLHIPPSNLLYTILFFTTANMAK